MVSNKLRLYVPDPHGAKPMAKVLVTVVLPPELVTFGVPRTVKPVLFSVFQTVAVTDPTKAMVPVPKLMVLALLLLLENTGVVKLKVPRASVPAVRVYPAVLVVVRLNGNVREPAACVIAAVQEAVVLPVFNKVMLLALPKVTLPPMLRLLKSMVPLFNVSCLVAPTARLAASV